MYPAPGTMPHLPQQPPSGGSHGAGAPVQPQAAANLAPRPSAPPEAVWQPFIKDIYPDLLTKTYFLPPLHFRLVPHSVDTIAGQVICIYEHQPPQGRRRKRRYRPHGPPSQVAGTVFTSNHPNLQPRRLHDSDLQDDQAQHGVLQYLWQLSESSEQVMMVISQLQFRKYLDNLGNPMNPALAALPTVAPLPVNLDDGECDILAIFLHYGFLIGEIKSVGGNEFFKNSSETEQNKMIVKKVRDAVEQLNNQSRALNHLVSDMPPLKITKVLILPNIESSQLQRALNTDSTVAQALCQCLQSAQDVPEAISRCLCKEQMSQDSPRQSWRDRITGIVSRSLSWLLARLQRHQNTSSSDNTEMETLIDDTETTSSLSTWWQHVVFDAGPDPHMTPGLYERLIARFCGPATTVEIPTLMPPRKVVKTLAEAVAETGLCMSSLALYPEQVDLLNDVNLDSVFLIGPPGTGKTVLLVIKGIQLLRKGKDVYLLSICTEGRSIAILVEQQLNVSKKGVPATGTVHRHHFDFKQAGEVTSAVSQLSALAGGNPLFILIDEVGYNVRNQFTEFCGRLNASVRPAGVSLWAAGLWLPTLPAWMERREVTVPLRCPPTVTDVVRQSESLEMGMTLSYNTRPVAPATDGPEVIRLSHRRRLGNLPLPFSRRGHNGSRSENCVRCWEDVAAVLHDDLRVGQSNAVQWRDVLILTNNPSPHSAMVQALDRNHIPVRVVGRHPPSADLQDLALADTNSVVITHCQNTLGLERRVVVGIGTGSWYQRRPFGMTMGVGMLMLFCLAIVLLAAVNGWAGWEVAVHLVIAGILVVLFLVVIRNLTNVVMGNILGRGMWLVLGVGLVVVLVMVLMLILLGLTLEMRLEMRMLLVLGVEVGLLLVLGVALVLISLWRRFRPAFLHKIVQWFMQRFGEREQLLGASRCTAQLVLIDDVASNAKGRNE